jgi:hypothetical protein
MLENWGLMTKAQDDATTIQQAIDAAISAHEVDPESHMGEGESIENHRTNDILDHPLGSVLADKITQTELLFTTTFDVSSIYYQHGTPTFIFPGFQISPTGNGFSNREAVAVEGESGQMTLSFNYDFLMQFAFSAEIGIHTTFRAECGFSLASETETGVGLEIIGNTARFYVAKEDGSSKSYLSWPSFQWDSYYVIRMQYVASEAKCYFYINGELLGTLIYPDKNQSDPLCLVFQIYQSATDGYSANIHNLTFAQALF